MNQVHLVKHVARPGTIIAANTSEHFPFPSLQNDTLPFDVIYGRRIYGSISAAKQTAETFFSHPACRPGRSLTYQKK